MIGVQEFAQMAGKPRGGFRRVGERKGSRKFVVLKDGSVVKWWNGVWRFRSTRWNRAVATSLTANALRVADERGRMVVDEERFSTFEDFADRMVKVVGLEELIRIVYWIKGGGS